MADNRSDRTIVYVAIALAAVCAVVLFIYNTSVH